MDLLGPFPISSPGNRWIIATTDYLARYADTKVLSYRTATEVAKFIPECILLRHDVPEGTPRGDTERGTAFTSHLLQKVTCLRHTSHRKTTAYHARANGMTERVNKTITGILSMYVDIEHKT